MAAPEQKSVRIQEHPILGVLPPVDDVTIYFEGKAIRARAGEPIMSALVAAGVSTFRYTKKGSPRRMFCGIGRCTDCIMNVDGVPGVRTCVTLVREGMKVERQIGTGSWQIQNETEAGNGAR
jgi:predicted molibdopterin-dependent oxidoreductase YjgC